jgi:AraC-like DNA-binding protein
LSLRINGKFTLQEIIGTVDPSQHHKFVKFVEASMSAVQYNVGRFDSPETFSRAAQAIGWETEFRQLNTGPTLNRLEIAATSESQGARVDFGGRLHQLVAPPPGCRAFGLLAKPQPPGKISHRRLDSESLIHMDPRNGMDAVSEAGFTGYTLAFSEERLSELADLHEWPDPLSSRSEPGTERFPAEAAVFRLRATVYKIFALARDPRHRDSAATLLNQELPVMILSTWFGSAEARKQKSGSRARALTRALDYLEASDGEALTVEQLRYACSSSISTVERAFRDRFGVTPKRYLLLHRLSGVRRALCDFTETRSITDVANQWGFWHMGKFASDYRRQFGELPSQTRLHANENLRNV